MHATSLPIFLGGQCSENIGITNVQEMTSHARELLPPFFNVRNFGATGDGKSIDSPAINKALEAAAAMGGGTVYVPAGTYNCYSLRLKSFICLYIEQGATILAAPTPLDGTTTDGYDAAEPQGPWEPYQDYGHNHWHTSLIWGEAIHDFSIMGPGLIWGKGLSRGHQNDKDLPDTTKPGVRNKTIALKNCFNVTLRDFSIFKGGWFGILATGVDNLAIDNLKIDTNRDGMDIDCCRNVRVSNCTVNSPILHSKFANRRRHLSQEFLRAGLCSSNRKSDHNQLLCHRQLRDRLHTRRQLEANAGFLRALCHWTDQVWNGIKREISQYYYFKLRL
jgi:hypothetical protein